MSASHSSFKNKQLLNMKGYVRGLFAYLPAPQTGSSKHDAGQFAVATGSSDIPDITVGAGSQTLIPDSEIPSGMRCYVTRLDVAVQGQTPWSSTALDGLVLKDSGGAPIAFLPVNALRGYSAYTFPDSDTEFPFTLGATAMAGITYVAATGVITGLTAAALINNTLVGVPFVVIAGSGKYSTGFITANTATGLTLSPAPALIDTTSVIAIWYYAATAGAATTVTFSNAATSQPAIATNALDNGFNAIVVAGTGIGQVRPIQSNTTTAATVPYAWSAAPDVTSIVHLSNESNLYGAIDMGISAKWPALSLNKGLVAALTAVGTVTAGSALRVYVEGYFAA